MHFYFSYSVTFELTWTECDTTVAIQTLSLMGRRAVYLAIMIGVFSLSPPMWVSWAPRNARVQQRLVLDLDHYIYGLHHLNSGILKNITIGGDIPQTLPL